MPREAVLWFVFAATVLLSCVSAEECAIARRLRENENRLFLGLRPPEGLKMAHTGCIRWFGGYWSYELCPGRWVRQYHEVKHVIVEEHILGVQHQWRLRDKVGSQLLQYSDGTQTIPDRLLKAGTTLDEGNSLYSCAKKGTEARVKQVDVTYPEGSPCETGFRRSSLLHFVCNEDAHIPVVTLKEPSFCEYDITVVAATICEAMFRVSKVVLDLVDADMKFAV
ncbi:uncharacterized protein Tco025E_01483 [Trypanosoma conorhini]|uniref:Uncharacterized protein n=1 Tax=Trypanosoma conorhini TaxID=83891 RepID=A0A422Q8N0_9TRYP|nr:uncharacterized protein Tco025E_01483 [Trypanosoma conorhini]RNF26316.1 hypothetical protein Tco025E_01483 [Trypanosoma conorhini]